MPPCTSYLAHSTQPITFPKDIQSYLPTYLPTSNKRKQKLTLRYFTQKKKIGLHLPPIDQGPRPPAGPGARAARQGRGQDRLRHLPARVERQGAQRGQGPGCRPRRPQQGGPARPHERRCRRSGSDPPGTSSGVGGGGDGGGSSYVYIIGASWLIRSAFYSMEAPR